MGGTTLLTKPTTLQVPVYISVTLKTKRCSFNTGYTRSCTFAHLHNQYFKSHPVFKQNKGISYSRAYYLSITCQDFMCRRIQYGAMWGWRLGQKNRLINGLVHLQEEYTKIHPFWRNLKNVLCCYKIINKYIKLQSGNTVKYLFKN